MPGSIRAELEETLVDDWNILHRYSVTESLSTTQSTEQKREVVVRPDSAVTLPYRLEKGTIFLVSQFRLPVYLETKQVSFLEAPSGRIDVGETPEEAAARETLEETGFVTPNLKKVASSFLNPALSSEQTHFFLAKLPPDACPSLEPDTSDMLGPYQVLEVDFKEAISMTRDGRIADAKTIILLSALSEHEAGINHA